MILRRAQRRPVKCLSFIWVLLAVAVFAWGLQYKLSLYPGEMAVPHRVPMAKLLTNDKQQGTAQAAMGQCLPDAGPQWTMALWLMPSLALTLAALLLMAFRRCSSSTLWLRIAFPPALRELTFLFFRPPPVYTPVLLSAQ